MTGKGFHLLDCEAGGKEDVLDDLLDGAIAWRWRWRECIVDH